MSQTYQCENKNCLSGGSFEAGPEEWFFEREYDLPKRCKPCKENGITNSQMYVCKNAGCVGEKHFTAAPEEVWRKKGQQLPANCPKCKEWIDSQKRLGEIVVRCILCGADWKVTPERRISHHRHEGDWEMFIGEIKKGRPCGPCEGNPYRVRSARVREAERLYAALPRKDGRVDRAIDETQGMAEKYGFLNAAHAFDIPTDPAFYASLINPDGTNGENELEHIMQKKHDFGPLTKDPSMLLEIIGKLANATQPTRIMQCRSGREIIKADIETGLVVILTQERMPQGSWRVRTSYLADDLPRYIERKVKKEKDWRV